MAEKWVRVDLRVRGVSEGLPLPIFWPYFRPNVIFFKIKIYHKITPGDCQGVAIFINLYETLLLLFLSLRERKILDRNKPTTFYIEAWEIPKNNVYYSSLS